MTVIIDACTCIAALVDTGPEGQWAETVPRQKPLVAALLILLESTDVLRRLKKSG